MRVTTTYNLPDRLDRVEALAERNREDIDVLIQGQTRLQNLQVELGQTQTALGRTRELLVEVLADVRTNLAELRAGQERQDRILDWVIRQQRGQ